MAYKLTKDEIATWSNDKEGLFNFLEARSSEYINDEASAKISDDRYDALKRFYEKTFKEKLPSGAPVVKNTLSAKQSYENLSITLYKAQDDDDLCEWLRRLLDNLGAGSVHVEEAFLEAGISLKYDGHSVTFEFEDNELTLAVTRGRNGVGKDLTDYFKKLRFAQGGSISKFYLHDTDTMQLSGITKFAIRCEAVITFDNLEKLNKEFNRSFKSPRSAMNGILSTDGFAYGKYLTLIPLEIRADGFDIPREEQMKVFDALQLSTSSEVFGEFTYVHVTQPEFDTLLEAIREFREAVIENRGEFPYLLDGIVVELMDSELRETLGYSGGEPNFAVAFKLPTDEHETPLRDVVWSTEGNTAVYCPKAVIEPVIIDNFTYDTISLANYRRFKRMHLRKDDNLIFTRNGDVLGYVIKPGIIEEEESEELDSDFAPPSHCRFCGQPLVDDGVNLRCVSTAMQCKLVAIGNIQNFLEKFGVVGIARNTVEKLYDAGKLTAIGHVLTIEADELVSLDGMGESSAENVISSLNRIRSGNFYDYELIGALNIEHLSRDRAKLFLKKYSIRELEQAVYNDKDSLLQLKDVGEALVSALQEAFDNHTPFIDLMVKKFPNMKQAKAEFKVASEPLTIVVTGDLVHQDRDRFKVALELEGHRLTSGVSKKTNYLVTNTPKSGTEKNRKATELGVKIVTEQEIYVILGWSDRFGEIEEEAVGGSTVKRSIVDIESEF